MSSRTGIRRLVIVGFGLIGGSVGLAARTRGLATQVVAVDQAPVLDVAKVRDAADEYIEAARWREALQDADLVVLATPVRTIAEHVVDALDRCPIVTDCGSTKRSIVAVSAGSRRSSRFVPGHPMAGRPDGGLERATADLFEGRPWILCPQGADGDAFASVEAFVSALGATPQCMTAEAHDEAVALTSHAPQLLASALAVLADDRGARAAAGPAFESATRVAGGGEAMWHDILSTNADQVADVIQDLAKRLETVTRGFKADPPDVSAALELLERARARRSEPR